MFTVIMLINTQLAGKSFQCIMELNSKLVCCEVNVGSCFVQFWNREYRTVNKIMLLNSRHIVSWYVNDDSR